MSKPLIGRTLRRLRTERGLTQQGLAARLGISASYLNLIEHDQRAVTAAVLIKLTEALGVDLAALSGQAERQLEAGLREVLSDPVLGLDAMPEEELRAMAGAAPNASRGVLALYRAWRVAREDASGIALPSGRRLLLLEGREAVEEALAGTTPTTPEADALIRIGLLNYAAAALLMPYAPFLAAARALRHDVEALAARFGTSFEQAAHRMATMQRDGARGVPFFFLRLDPAGNVTKRFSAAGFPFARFGGNCPKWMVHHAFSTPGQVRVQAAELEDGAAFLCFARASHGPAPRWGEPAPMQVVAMGCDVNRADEVVYGDGLDLSRRVGIGLSCRLCERPDCRSRAFPPLEHRLRLDANEDSAAPWRFEKRGTP